MVNKLKFFSNLIVSDFNEKHSELETITYSLKA